MWKKRNLILQPTQFNRLFRDKISAGDAGLPHSRVPFSRLTTQKKMLLFHDSLTFFLFFSNTLSCYTTNSLYSQMSPVKTSKFFLAGKDSASWSASWSIRVRVPEANATLSIISRLSLNHESRGSEYFWRKRRWDSLHSFFPQIPILKTSACVPPYIAFTNHIVVLNLTNSVQEKRESADRKSSRGCV